MKSFILLCSMLFAFNVCAQTRTPLVVDGFVVDAASGKPLVGVNVSVDGDQGAGPAATDNNGHFTLNLAPSVKAGDTIQISLKLEGYTPWHEGFAVPSKGLSHIFKLTRINKTKPSAAKTRSTDVPMNTTAPTANVSVHMGCEPDHLPIHIYPATTVHIIRMLPSILRSSNSTLPGLGVFEEIDSNSDKGIDWPPESEAKLRTWDEMHKSAIETQTTVTPYTSRCTLTSYSNATLESISTNLVIDTSDNQRHSYPVKFEPLVTGSGFTFYLVNVCSSGVVPLLVQWQDWAVVRVLGEPNQRMVPLEFKKNAFPSSMSVPFGASWYKWSGVPACKDW